MQIAPARPAVLAAAMLTTCLLLAPTVFARPRTTAVRASNGNVFITVGAGDNVGLSQTGDSHDLTVTSELIDPIVVSLRGSLVIDMLGAAGVSMQTLTVPHNLLIKGSRFSDDVTCSNTAVGGYCWISDFSGSDDYAFTNLQVEKDLVLRTHRGGDTASFTDCAIGRSGRLLLGVGSNNLQLLRTSVGRDLFIDGRRGDDLVTVTSDASPVLIGRSLSIFGGAGENDLQVDRIVVGKRTSIRATGRHAAGTTISVSNSTLARTDIVLGPGDGAFTSTANAYIGTTAWGLHSTRSGGSQVHSDGDTFGHRMHLYLGSGDDAASLTDGVWNGHLVVRCGAGNDTVTSTGNAFNDGVEFDGGPGTDTLSEDADSGNVKSRNFEAAP